MSVYEGFRVYGPYTRKSDGRQIIRLRTINKPYIMKTVSYPKYIVETHLDRTLKPDEVVDHIDGDFLNNDLSNLRIVDRSTHTKSHQNLKVTQHKTCVVCGKEFQSKSGKRITCGSKSCAGKLAHTIGYNKGHKYSGTTQLYVSNRSLLSETLAVDAANSANPLVGNAEQEIK